MIRDYRDRPSETGDLRRHVDDIVNRHDRDPVARRGRPTMGFRVRVTGMRRTGV